jgi:hypothetical protein
MSTLSAVKDTLGQYREMLAAKKAGKEVDLLPLLQQLAEFSKNPPADADPRLRHYLESQSYNKAWDHLED